MTGKAGMPGVFPESQVVKIWQEQVWGRTDLITEENGPVQIVYPGRPNDDRGADIRDAVIVNGQGLVLGDIEIHVKSSNWWAHHHHRDPAYNRVILHVVYYHDETTAIVLQDGRTVPTLALQRYSENQFGAASVSPLTFQRKSCRSTHHGDNSIIGEILDTAGDSWFRARVDNYQAALSGVESGQVLFQGIMRALGYTKNRQQMEELARRIPIRCLESIPDTLPDIEYLVHCQGLLMGMAGLLPSQSARNYTATFMTEPWIARLERAWNTSDKAAAMSENDWEFFKVRPGNYPTRRIVAMSHLLLRYRKKGILAGLLESIDEISAETGRGVLEMSVMVTAGDYLSCGPAGDISDGSNIPAFIGNDRAADIVVNVLLPFAEALGEMSSQPERARNVSNLYRGHPVLAGNTIERHMIRQLGIYGTLVNTARRQQGLLHIYKTYCIQGQCRDCPMTGDNV